MIQLLRSSAHSAVIFPDSDGFCGFQKIPKESGIIHGSEEGQLMRTGCETPRLPHMRGLLLATTENSRTRKTGASLFCVGNAGIHAAKWDHITEGISWTKCGK